MTNDYEKSLLQSKAGLTDAQLLERVEVRVTTLGKDGVEIAAHGATRIRVPAAQVRQVVDPTGVGDVSIPWNRGGRRYAAWASRARVSDRS